MMGTGKTTVGKIVAQRLGRPFFDSDELIESRTGRTVRQIFRDDGEDAFRAEESRALLDALASPVPAVIAAAGGVVLSDAESRGAPIGRCAGRVAARRSVAAGRPRR